MTAPHEELLEFEAHEKLRHWVGILAGKPIEPNTAWSIKPSEALRRMKEARWIGHDIRIDMLLHDEAAREEAAEREERRIDALRESGDLWDSRHLPGHSNLRVWDRATGRVWYAVDTSGNFWQDHGVDAYKAVLDQMHHEHPKYWRLVAGNIWDKLTPDQRERFA